jgi:hypothetical protein
MNNHLTPQQMLAYIDGELSKSETRRAEDHLHSCWTCLTEVERLKGDIATILDAQSESFLPALPPPPRPWPSVETVLARGLSAQPISVWMRLTAFLNTFLTPVRILLVSGVVAVLFVCVYSIFQTETVSAKEVMRRMRIADTQRSTIKKNEVIRERIHIRKRLHSQSQLQLASIETWKSPTAAYWNVEESGATAADLKAQYQTHNIPVGLPLSAESVNSWGKAAGGNPTVSRQGSDLDLSFAGSSEGVEGSVERVSVLVQPETWQVKQMTLDFPDASFQVTEDDYSVIRTSAVPADLLARLEPEVPPAMITQPVSSIAASAIHLPMVNLDRAELDVFATLHGLKADLGEPVTVTRSNQAVQVGVWQLPAERQNELREALVDQPGVQVQFAVPRVPLKRATVARTMPPPTPGEAALPIDVESGGDDQRLLKFFGGPEREQDFTNNALGTSTAILSHLYALRNLQGQFPAERDRSLAPEEQAQLRALVQDHATAISANVDALGRLLAPLDADFSVSPCPAPDAPEVTNWQSGSLKSLETARVIDHLLRALLTTSQMPAVPDSALPQINQNLCSLRAQLSGLGGQIVH